MSGKYGQNSFFAVSFLFSDSLLAMVIKRMFSILLYYLLFLLILFCFQRKLMYFPDKHSIEQQQELAEQLNLKLWPSKDNYLGLMLKSANTTYKGTIIVFHGNAGSAINRIYYLQAKWLIRDKYNNIKNLQNYPGSIAVLLAGEDEIIPNKYSLNLFNALHYRKQLWTFKGTGHNSLPLAPELPWWQDVMQFVAEQNGESL